MKAWDDYNEKQKHGRKRRVTFCLDRDGYDALRSAVLSRPLGMQNASETANELLAGSAYVNRRLRTWLDGTLRELNPDLEDWRAGLVRCVEHVKEQIEEGGKE